MISSTPDTGTPNRAAADSLRVPYGLREDGVLVQASQAEKGTRYCCPSPSCGVGLTLRAGSRRQHFAHKVVACSVESVLHWTAKTLVAQVVKEWKKGGGLRPTIARTCPGCSTTKVIDVPDVVERAELEQELPNGLRPDVTLVLPGRLPALVEIFMSHEVDAIKRERLADYRWIEVEAQTIVDEPLCWQPIQDHFNPFPCAVCAEAKLREAERRRQEEERARQAEAEEARERAERAARVRAEEAAAQAFGQRHRIRWKSPYVARVRACWADRACGRDTLIFDWPRDRLWDWVRPPLPIPRTVKRVYMEERRRHYWGNTCIHCGRKQGDLYIDHIFE